MSAMTTTAGMPSSASLRSQQNKRIRAFVFSGLLTLFMVWIVVLYLRPLYYNINLSLGGPSRDVGQPDYPVTGRTFTFEGQTLDLYKVPTENGVRELAILEKSRSESVFVDPATGQKITWQGSWRTLERVWDFNPRWSNYAEASKLINFPRLFLNTLIVAVLGTIGTVLSSVLVAYGFARFRFPYKEIMIQILMATVILPQQVTVVPQYIIFYKVGWVGTWLPLIVPLFFGSAFSIFLLRQFFMNIPRDLDEAAMLDGASPFRTLISIIVPLSLPAIISVAIAQFIYLWNDFYYSVLYLAGKQELMTISPALLSFNSVYGGANPQLIAAASMLASLLPVALFFLAQRPFMRAMMMPGLDK